MSDLRDLLDRYCFADSALQKHLKALRPADRRMLQGEMAEAFAKLLETSTGGPAIAILQLRALIGCLSAASLDRDVRMRLVGTAEKHLDELTVAMGRRSQSKAKPGRTYGSDKGWLSDDDLRALDDDHDRAVVVGTDYRYRYSNHANAAFHGSSAASMIGKPLWETTSATFFERVTKPVVDRCLAGHPASFVSSHPGRPAAHVHSAHLHPIRDKRGHVVAALGIIRLVDCVVAD